MDDNSPDFGNFDIYVDDIFVGGTSATNTGSTFDLTKYLFFNNHTIKITGSCQFHGTSETIINYTAAVPPVLSFNAPGVNIFMFDGEYQLSISPRSSSDGIIYPQGFDIYVNDAYVLSTQASENGRVLSAAALGIETGVEYTFTVVDTADASLTTTITGTLSK